VCKSKLILPHPFMPHKRLMGSPQNRRATRQLRTKQL